MRQKDYEIARELKKRISKKVKLIDLKIFGSRAEEKSSKYSDMDVFIEVEKIDKQLEEKIYKIAWDVGFDNEVFISPLIFSRYEIEQSPLRVSPIVRNIEETGVRI